MKTKPLNMFKLKWRWTDPKYCLLPVGDLAKIFPLEAESANEAWKKSLTFSSSGNEFSPNSEKFEHIESIDTNNNTEVKSWLTKRMSKGPIIVSWQPDVAVITDADTFIKYWGEFCYPSSDDVSIWPEGEEWVIHYWHEEVLWYGMTKSV